VQRIILIAIIATLATAACLNRAASSDSVTVFSASNEPPLVVTEPSTVAALNKLWASKQPVLLKRRPEFGFRVELRLGKSAGSWLYSSDGYTVLASEPYGTTYQLMDRAMVNQWLGIAQ